jgi:transposase
VQGNHITVELALPNLVVERQTERGETITVEVRFRCEERRCPRCGRVTKQVHQYHNQLKQHQSLWGKRILLLLRKRRFRCAGCDKVFMESDEVCGWRRRCTKALREYVAQESLTRTVRAVAGGEGVSEALVRRAFSEMAHRKVDGVQTASGALALDEVSLGPQQGYLTVLYAPEKRQVVGLHQGRTQEAAEALLSGLAEGERVEAVVMDMTEPYRQAVHVCCPHAVIVADKFHMLRHVLAQVDRVRAEVQGQAKGARLELFRRRSLFTADAATLNRDQRRDLARLLRGYPELGRAWRLAQQFRRFYRSGSRREAALALRRWWERVRRHGPRQFLSLRHILTHWREEILNYFDYRVTNGFAEGKNNRIKVITRSGYGYRNLENLGLRILMTNHPPSYAAAPC